MEIGHKRLKLKQILNLDIDQLKNHKILNFVKNYRKKDNKIYGYGNSDKKFYQALNTKLSGIFQDKIF